MALGHKNNNKKNMRQGLHRKAHFSSRDTEWRTKALPKKLGREELAIVDGQHVNFSGDLVMKYKKICEKPVLLEHVVVDGVYIDHMWVEFDRNDQEKLRMTCTNVRIYCTGVVKLYAKVIGKMKDQYGLRHVKLVTE